ncbi:hypothetical protein DUHN55_44380 [Helicobacter pylori]
MSYSHSNVYVVRVVDERATESRTRYVGPYGSTRADQTADRLEVEAREKNIERSCHVEALFSDDECLRVDDYVRSTAGSLV